MSAKARDLPPAGPDETVVYPEDGAGLDRPAGGPAASPGKHRYTFASGSRPLEGYTIKRAVGRGGFGEVYYATSDSGKEVALKLITRNLEIERRGVAQCMNLKCPNLLAIHDIKTNDAGDTFVIMEYVAGPSLASVLAQHPQGLPLGEVRAWLKGLVEGVAYLHDHGIVHRDLKPANLFMEEGVVKIGDYGLSKMISSQPASHHSESIGTCHYMAPEIATGKYHKPIDIYAIGVILFEMITGHVPFAGETVGEVLIKHLTTRPDLSALPEPYRTIVGQALAKDPNHRPQRVVGLLPPEDAPRPRDVRFIGEGKGAAPSSPPIPPRPKPADDGILRITDEEPVLYIGPDTVPPRGRPGFNPFARRASPRPARPAPRTARPDIARRVRLIATEPLVPPPPSIPPPPLPTGRARVAELAGSMLGAAFWAALATALFGIVAEFDPHRRPQDVAFVFTTILLGSWAALVPAKFAEGGTAGTMSRRLASASLGMALGVIAQILAGWMLAGPPHAGGPTVNLVDFFDAGPIALDLPDVIRLALTFALAFGAIDWWSMTDRDRKARFRLGPIVRATALAAVPALLLLGPDRSLVIVPVLVLTAAVVQVVSPWSEVAARYAEATRPDRTRNVA